MRFRPCIDIHDGKVKQIVGSSLSDLDPGSVATNFSTDLSPAHFAAMYRDDALFGGHVIMLGGRDEVREANERAALEAVTAFPGGFHVGGGITPANTRFWLDHGAGAVIVTSYVFSDGTIHTRKLQKMSAVAGRESLVLDLSCRKKEGRYHVVTDRWQKFTETLLSPATLLFFADFCSEFLVHAADVEGKCSGIDPELVEFLAGASPIPVTYAGGVRNMDDLLRIDRLGAGKVDATVGSALDIFGGSLPYKQVVAFHRERNRRHGA